MAGVLRMVLALSVVAGLAACETAKGFVRDSENVGRVVAKELND
ncbi:hypothetical protein SAMN05444004_103126 [Jannaschia faecimaris]|uniref:Entericidin EcnA/B family protein n=1 Tax=Jannaschia faecimaris TaxID=1244108 RepID=A0A1H3MP16_9RHOB|nr:entericidin [Jannaschia faecimaris]SDY78240.1 hypothetical protein SAMN05444004_103126 [Jannaschia faecimaris]